METVTDPRPQCRREGTPFDHPKLAR